MEPPGASDDLLVAAHRADHLAQHGATVVGVSTQATAAGLSVVWVLLASPASFDTATLPWFAVAAAGAVLGVASWVRARRRHTLLPHSVEIPERPLGALDAERRRSVGRQLRGREAVRPDTASLVRSMLLWQRRNTRSAAPSLVAMGLGLLGLTGSSTFPALVWIIVATIVVVAVLGMVEARRRTRVLAAVDRLATPD